MGNLKQNVAYFGNSDFLLYTHHDKMMRSNILKLYFDSMAISDKLYE